MAQINIPEPWRTHVCAVLETEATGQSIQWTDDATKRFEASFLEAWPYQVYAAFRSYLCGKNPTGCLITMPRTAGKTYEFFFDFRGEKTYGKILLRTDERIIVIFSAHLPLKDNLDCD
jgi:hypothetical protein